METIRLVQAHLYSSYTFDAELDTSAEYNAAARAINMLHDATSSNPGVSLERPCFATKQNCFIATSPSKYNMGKVHGFGW